MTDINPEDVLFCGKGRSVPGWYRCALPAMELGCDWAGLVDSPPGVGLVTGNVPRVSDWDRYKVVIAQQWAGEYWHDHVQELRSRGTVVLYELDDNLDGVRHQPDHEQRMSYTAENVAAHMDVMVACDGLIVSTPRLKEIYGDPNNLPTWVCRNGIDVGRYAVTPPERETVNVGWFGGTGHRIAVSRWMDAVNDVMSRHEQVRFVNVGEPVADLLWPENRQRSLYIPWASLECFPAAIANIDVSLAPAGTGPFFDGKSDLRWLEAGALGIATVADPRVYGESEHGRTALHARGHDDVVEALEVLCTPHGGAELRRAIGGAARAYVRETRSIEATATDWIAAIEGAT